jgi:hypothetical protein
MKKFIALLLLFSSLANAQDSTLVKKKNEFRVDVLSAILYQKASFSYERFLGSSFSTGLNVNFSNTKKNKKDFDEGSTNNFAKFEINPYVRYALSKSQTRYYFAEIFASYNGGDYKEIIRMVDANSNGYYTTKVSKYTDVGAGACVGYKMYFNKSIALEFLVGFGYNFINPDKSPDKITRVGLNLGYRF